ncbi:hypothetical protein EVAR_63897_1 [Eumeta japonica]|uniref:Uncharacterized protein n=1 Tax=Eumeta variegata TaxID=151549 RepID=A0A4C1ZQN6_EUMVA|nr:hypothetical protein EVAR_63897_1 [Eumeta japonica]
MEAGDGIEIKIFLSRETPNHSPLEQADELISYALGRQHVTSQGNPAVPAIDSVVSFCLALDSGRNPAFDSERNRVEIKNGTKIVIDRGVEIESRT